MHACSKVVLKTGLTCGCLSDSVSHMCLLHMTFHPVSGIDNSISVQNIPSNASGFSLAFVTSPLGHDERGRQRQVHPSAPCPIGNPAPTHVFTRLPQNGQAPKDQRAAPGLDAHLETHALTHTHSVSITLPSELQVTQVIR